MIFSRFTLIVILCCFYSEYASSQGDSTQVQRPVIGLALSGGGAKGYAHIGVLQVLKEHGIQVDRIAGTSMGAVVGGLYAIGYSPDSLVSLFKAENWNQYYTDAINRNEKILEVKSLDERYVFSVPAKGLSIDLPSGLIAGQRFTQFLNRISFHVHGEQDFNKFPIPFAAVATRLDNGQEYVITKGRFTKAIRASTGIPTIFQPTEIDGVKLIDGGVVRNFPVQDVLAMGADIVIGVDLSPEFDKVDTTATLLTIMEQSISFQIKRTTEEQRNLAHFVIYPDVAEFSIGDFNNVDAIVERGRNAAREAIPFILELLNRDEIPAIHSRPAPRIPPSYIFVEKVTFKDIKEAKKVFLEYGLNIRPKSYIRLEELNKSINVLYSSELFTLIDYEVIPMSEGKYHLIISAQERHSDALRFGFRYDDTFKSSLLINSTLRNVLRSGAWLSTDIRLGEEFLMEMSYYSYAKTRPRIAANTKLTLVRTNTDVFQQTTKIANSTISSAHLQFLLNTVFTDNVSSSFGAKKEWFHELPNINPIGLRERSDTFHSLFMEFKYDNLDRLSFPRHGLRIQAKSEWSSSLIRSNLDFMLHAIQSTLAYELVDGFSFFSSLNVGYLNGSSIPPHYMFQLGGAYPSMVIPFREHGFWGMNIREQLGSVVRVVQAGFQSELDKNKFLRFGYNLGEITEQIHLYPSHETLERGGMIAFGALTAIGPVELLMSSSTRHEFIVSLNVGYRF